MPESRAIASDRTIITISPPRLANRTAFSLPRLIEVRGRVIDRGQDEQEPEKAVVVPLNERESQVARVRNYEYSCLQGRGQRIKPEEHIKVWTNFCLPAF